MSATKKVMLLFGGSGFVGVPVVRKALQRGYHVIVATRSGTPEMGSPLYELHRLGVPPLATNPSSSGSPSSGSSSASCTSTAIEEAVVKPNAPPADRLQFVSIDAASRTQVFDFMHDHPQATAVVSCVGALTRDYDEAREINGDTNTNIAAGVAHPRLVPAVKKMVYVSAEPLNQYAPRTLGHKRMLKGYFHGKRIAERAVLDNLGEKGVVLRPAMIYGSRPVMLASGQMIHIPLWLVGKPLELLFSAVNGTKLLTPPVDVEVVAETIVRACDWGETSPVSSQLAERNIHGIIDVRRMQELCAMDEPLGLGTATQTSGV